MSNDSTKASSGAVIQTATHGSFTLELPATSSTPVVNVDEDDVREPPTPEYFSRRQRNVFRRQKRAALRIQKAQKKAAEDASIWPDGYREGQFGREARKLIRSSDAHGMLKEEAHDEIKPKILRYYQYGKCYKTARAMADAKTKKVTRMS
ncbi:hypothetical protein E4T43_05388 [Aureobasidium subglaciale]|nr:hypothetical protein E4T43_05388 [Aureobasidium subglaciale]